MVDHPSGKCFTPKPRPDVAERVVCRFAEEGCAEEGERVVCNLNALLGKEGMELVEAELPQLCPPEVQVQETEPLAPSPIHLPVGLPPTQSAYAIAMRRGGQPWSSLV